MRFERLHIPAFGPFTNLELTFPPREHDLHVIYGKNEAGKSSLLRAIRDLLFGIHGQSPDNFLHEYKNLRLLGEITNRAGERLGFQRRKGNKNTLLDEGGNPLPDHALRPFLGNVEQDFFSTMFGLGSSELREGAKQILGGDGDIGKALFSASLGGTPVQRVLDSLIAESEKIFKGRATSNVSIRPSVKRYHELMKQSREAMVAAEVWDELNRSLESANSRKVQLDGEIAECEVEISWVSRCEDALPSASRFIEELRLLGELPALPDVANDFVERAKAARNDASESSRTVLGISAQLEGLVGQLSKCETAPEVMAIEDEVDGLRQDLGAYRNRKESLSILQSKLAGIEPSLRTGMEGLEIRGDFEVLDSMRLGSAARLGLEAAAQSLIDAQGRHVLILQKADELTAAIQRSEKSLQSLPVTNLEPIRAALALASEAIEAHKTLEATRATVDHLTRKLQEEHSLVIGAPRDFEVACRLQVPTKATLRKFRDRFHELEREREAAAKRINDGNIHLIKLREDLTRLERRGELPTEDSLKKARDHRDRGWQLVLKDWKGKGTHDQLDPLLPLEEAFPLSIQAADRISDQLRLDADAVAQAEEKRIQIQSSLVLIEKCESELGVIEDSTRKCQASWDDEWASTGIGPRSPDEMEEWREGWMQFRETFGNLHEAKDALRSKSEQIGQAMDTLKAALGTADGKPFAVMFEAAKACLQQGEEATGRRKLIVEQIANLHAELKQSNDRTALNVSKIQAAKADWQTRCQAAGLAADTTPEAGLWLLQERNAIIAKFDQWREWSNEAKKTAEFIEAYEIKVCGLAAALGVEADSAETREAALWKTLTAARIAQTEHDQLASQIDDAKGRLILAREEETKSSGILGELMSFAKLNKVEDLEPLLAALERRASIQQRLEHTRDTLGGLARGQSVEDFVNLVQAENADELPQRKARLDSIKSDKKAELQTVEAELNDLNRRREELAKAGDTAADLRQQAEGELAVLRRDASQFVRLRLAANLLKRQIERFREQNQAPLLEKSGLMFQQITRGAFEGLAAEVNDQDVPVLVGNRASGVNVPVEGMSDGTRDQLYLALRLAALDRHLEEHEPMPMILDDLLITFDNDRTKAILPQLADLSKRTQVFLFTHHEHLVDLCRDTLDEDAFHLHVLETSGIPKGAASTR